MLGLETWRAPSLDVPACLPGFFRLADSSDPPAWSPPLPFPSPPSQNTKEKNRWAGAALGWMRLGHSSWTHSCQIITTPSKIPRSPLLPFAITNQPSIAFFLPYPDLTWPYTVLTYLTRSLRSFRPLTVFLCFSETAEAFPPPPRLDANFSLFGIRFCAWFGLWAALPLSTSIIYYFQVEETAFYHRPIIRLFFCFVLFFLFCLLSHENLVDRYT